MSTKEELLLEIQEEKPEVLEIIEQMATTLEVVGEMLDDPELSKGVDRVLSGYAPIIKRMYAHPVFAQILEGFETRIADKIVSRLLEMGSIKK